jgi:replicative DNA helicase
MLTLPRAHVIGPRGLEPAWARVADFIVDIERPDLLDSHSTRPGEADITIVKNRLGPQLRTTVAFQGHYARFVDMADQR